MEGDGLVEGCGEDAAVAGGSASTGNDLEGARGDGFDDAHFLEVGGVVLVVATEVGGKANGNVVCCF